MKEEIVKNDSFNDLKDLLIFNNSIVNTTVEARVPYSRFKIIMSNYLTLNGIFIDIEKKLQSNYFILSKLDNRGNVFKIIKDCNEETEKALSKGKCSCGRRKHDDKEKCYYCIRTEVNYLTKINVRL